VSGNLFIYYQEGDPGKSVAPDVFFVRGVSKHERRIYQLWEEGRAPDVVFEISSRKTILKDTQQKMRLYERLGVKEYFLYDPEYDWMPDGLAAYRLSDGRLTEVELADGVTRSDVLGLDLVDTGETLRLRNPQTGRFLPTREEMIEARQQAEVAKEQAEVAREQAEAAREQAEAAREQAEIRARAEASAREKAEAELTRLREEITRIRSHS
jgi:hypothetical protein